MGERKAVNKYFPPDYDPRMGSLDKYHGIHPLRERAKKIHEGILVIRFEMPYNIWCNGCEKHIGMGVRYNAEKQKVGNYYTTPIYKFRMKCHLCDKYFEIQTDPKNCDYQILSGCRRKEERWDTEKAGNVQTTHREEKQKMMTSAMYKLEHQTVDEGKVQKLAPTLGRLQEIRDVFDDDFYVNQVLRKQFREEKKELQVNKEKDNNLKRKICFPLDFKLANESEEDVIKAKKISYGMEGEKKNISAETRRRQVKGASIFGISNNSKMSLAKSLVIKSKKSSTYPSIKTYSSSLDIGIKVTGKPQKEVDVPKKTRIDSCTLSTQLNATKKLQKDDDVSSSSKDVSSSSKDVSSSTCWTSEQSTIPNFICDISEGQLQNISSNSYNENILVGGSSCDTNSTVCGVSKASDIVDHTYDKDSSISLIDSSIKDLHNVTNEPLPSIATNENTSSSENTGTICNCNSGCLGNTGTICNSGCLGDIQNSENDKCRRTKSSFNLNVDKVCVNCYGVCICCKLNDGEIPLEHVVCTDSGDGDILLPPAGEKSNASLVDYCSSSSSDENN